MNNRLYNSILYSIHKEIKTAIDEQFNIGNMNLDGKRKMNNNIFNKNVTDPLKVYKNILGWKNISEYDIEQLDNIISYVKPEDKYKLVKIVQYYSDNYNTHSLNWLDVSDLTDLAEIFSFSEYTGDISKWDVSNVTDMRETFS